MACCCKRKEGSTPRPSPPPGVKIVRLLSEIDRIYRVHMVFGSISAAALGVVFPAFSIVFGQLFNIFVTQTPAQIRSSASIIAGK